LLHGGNISSNLKFADARLRDDWVGEEILT
jgi:hypothetical protein